MSDARIIHKKASGGERVCSLTHLEHRVWVQYVLSCDDYGVMRDSVSQLLADNPRLEKEPLAKVESALARVVAVGLVSVFVHQGTRFLWQRDWQDFQGIRYPRATVHPAPSPEDLATATKKTRELFAQRPKDSREHFDESAEIVPTPARAGAARNTHSTSHSHPDTHPHPEESARETTPAPLVNGAELRRHGSHAWCSWPARDGLCVPVFLHHEFVGKLSTPDAAAELLAWYPQVLTTFVGQAIGDDALRFWRKAFTAWVGTAPIAAHQSRPDDDWFDECQRLHNRACNGRVGHALQMDLDAARREREAS